MLPPTVQFLASPDTPGPESPGRPLVAKIRDLIRLLVAAWPLKPLPSLFLAIRLLLRLPMLPPVARHLRGPRPMPSRPLVLVPSYQGVRQNAVAMRLGLVVAVPLADPVGLVTGFVACCAPFPDFF